LKLLKGLKQILMRGLLTPTLNLVPTMLLAACTYSKETAGRDAHKRNAIKVIVVYVRINTHNSMYQLSASIAFCTLKTKKQL
jgi:hypothetical protein